MVYHIGVVYLKKPVVNIATIFSGKEKSPWSLIICPKIQIQCETEFEPRSSWIQSYAFYYFAGLHFNYLCMSKTSHGEKGKWWQGWES